MSTPIILKRQKQSGAMMEYRINKIIGFRINNDGWNVLTAIDPYTSNTLKLNVILDYIYAIEDKTAQKSVIDRIIKLHNMNVHETNGDHARTRMTTMQLNIDKLNYQSYCIKCDNILDPQIMCRAITYALTNLLECGFIVEILKAGLCKCL